MKTIKQAAFLGLFVLAAFAGATRVPAATPTDDAQAALGTLRAWLATDDGAAAWNKFLRSEELTAELAKGAAADRDVVRRILEIYSGPTPGLDRPKFQAVRQALEAWLAEVSALKAEELPAAARAAASQFAPTDPERSAKAKARLNNALSVLDAWLVKSGDKVHAGWKRHLVWDELQGQLAEGAQPNVQELAPIIAKYRGNENGLELRRFIAVRDALRSYAEALEFSSEDQLKEEFPKRLEELAVRLEAFAKNGAGEDLAEAGRIAGWLEQAGQTPNLVAGVRKHYSRPNLYAHLSSDLINAAAAEEVNETTAVSEVILGTQMQGTAYTRGRISAGLVPSTGSASLEIVLRGNTFSDNVGWQGPVTIYSTGNTSVYASTRLIIDAAGVRALPATASCTTASSINDIEAPLRLIERIAWRKAGQSQGAAERVASGKAESRVADRMNSRVAELVEQANANYQDKFKKPLLRRGEFPRKVDMQSTAERLTVRVGQINALQLGAPDAPPDVIGGQDMSVRLHESMVSNFAESAIGGETLTDKRLHDMLLEATGNVPEELRLSDDKDPWSITFHSVRPISAAFAGQEVKLTLRGQRFTRGENAIKEPMQISAVYKIERTGNGMKFVRQGEVVADYIEKPARLSVTQVAFKTFLKRKFNALFKEEIDRGQDGLALPGRLAKLGNLPLDMISADKGWLVAAWKLPEKTRTAQAKTK